MRGKISKRLFNDLSIRGKFIVIIIFIIIVLGTVSIASTRYITSIIHEIIHRENPKVEATLEMEININEGTQNVLNYHTLKEEIEKEMFNDNVNDFILFRKQFGDIIITNDEKELLTEIDSLFFIYRKTASDIFYLKNKQDVIFEHSSKLIKDSIDHILDDILQSQTIYNSKKKEALYEIEINFFEYFSSTINYMHKPDTALINRIIDSKQDLEKAARQYTGLPLNKTEKKYLELLMSIWDIIKTNTDKIVNLEIQQQNQLNDFDKVNSEIDFILDNKLQVVVKNHIRDDETRAVNSSKYLAVTSLLSIIVIVLAFYFVARSIISPIAKLVHYTNEVGKSKFDIKIEIKNRKDELGQLASSFSNMIKNLGIAHNEILKQKGIIEKKNINMLDSIRYAKRIQNLILPPLKLLKQNLEESFVLYKPKDIVGGDFYWLHTTQDKIYFAVADCTGHGVPGAFISVVCSNSLNNAVHEYKKTEPAEILDKTLELVINQFHKNESGLSDGMDIALCCLNLKTNKLNYSGANNPLYMVRNKELIIIGPDKQPIGHYIKSKPFTNHIIDLQKGDCLYIFSDGYADQFGGNNGRKFLIKNFKAMILENHEKTMAQQKQVYNNTLKEWIAGGEQTDDICMVGLQI